MRLFSRRTKTHTSPPSSRKWFVHLVFVWGIVLGLVGGWIAGVWFLLTTAQEVARLEARAARQSTLTSLRQEMERLTRSLEEQYVAAEGEWYSSTSPAVALLEAVEQQAQEAGLEWETTSARETSQTPSLPASIEIAAKFQGGWEELERFLAEVFHLTGHPHPRALTLERVDGVWGGTIVLRAFRVPQEAGHQEAAGRTNAPAREPLGDPDEHP